MMANETIETVRSHRWELAGLGRAPFTCFGMTEQRHDMGGGHSKAGGTCDYCGQGILYVFHIRSSDGRKFKVGCDCVAHTHDAAETIVTQTKKMLKDHKRAKRVAGVAAKRKAEKEAREAKWKAEREANLIALAIDPLYLRIKAIVGEANYAGAEGHAGNSFLQQMRDSMERFGALTEGQEIVTLRILDRIENEPARKAGSQHVGNVGDRIDIVGTVEFSKCIHYKEWYGDIERHLNKIRTNDGNLLIWFGAYGLEQGASIQGTAKIKDHSEYQNEKQTIIKNPRWKEI